MLFILHKVLLEDIQILSDNIYKNLNRTDFTADLTCKTRPNKKGWSRIPLHALPAPPDSGWWSHASRIAQEHPCSRNAPCTHEDAHGSGPLGGVRSLLSGEGQMLSFSHPPEAH